MTQTWRNDLRAWARQSAVEFQHKEGVLGVVIGGSLARGQEWRHSDLELGILMEERNSNLPYFNIVQERGVEAIQLVRRELEEQVGRVESGDLSPVLQWPIQLWACRVIYDPTGLLARFKKQFDTELFAPEVIAKKVSNLRQSIDQKLKEARTLLTQERPAAAFVQTRWAMNEAILAAHWAHGELPRSQNRTDSRLRWLCKKHSILPFYFLYRDVFDLSDSTQVIQTIWPKVKDQALEITRLWGDLTRDFFIHAVDSNFSWRQNAGILTVYRLFIPIIGQPERGIFTLLDDPEWASRNIDLMRFLGLYNLDPGAVAALIERVSDSSEYFPA